MYVICIWKDMTTFLARINHLFFICILNIGIVSKKKSLSLHCLLDDLHVCTGKPLNWKKKILSEAIEVHVQLTTTARATFNKVGCQDGC